MSDEVVDASLLGAAMEADKKLSDRDKKDTGGLPPGHPALIAIEDAQLRFQLRQQMEEERERENIKHVKKLGVKEKKENRRKEAQQRIENDKQNEKLGQTAKLVNAGIDGVIDSMNEFTEKMEEAKKIFEKCPAVMMRITRLERLMAACHRGILESRLRPQHLSSVIE